MSKPDIVPKQSASGIAIDSHTLDRVIPASSRPDGSVRKERKVRPGFTPQEDVERFRGTRQQELDRSVLPKGHILGWIPPSTATKKAPTTANNGSGADKAISKSARKNLKRKQKKECEKSRIIRETWEQSDEEQDLSTQMTEEQTKEEEIQPPNETSLQSGQSVEPSQQLSEAATNRGSSENAGIRDTAADSSDVVTLATEVQERLDIC